MDSGSNESSAFVLNKRNSNGLKYGHAWIDGGSHNKLYIQIRSKIECKDKEYNKNYIIFPISNVI